MAFRIALLTGLLPAVAAAGAYLIAIYQGYDAVCIPLFEGCTSVSRAARYQDAIFWFRGLMMPMSVLLVIYWVLLARWLDDLAGPRRLHRIMLVLGCISALALILYANFLGSEGSVYRVLRRFGVTVYFGLSLMAQLLYLRAVQQRRGRLLPQSQRCVTWQQGCVGAQWLLGLVSLSTDFMEPGLKYRIDNILEWNFALAMILFHGLNAGIWRQHPPPPAKE